MVIWAAVGGKGTLIGAILGALVVNFSKSIISESFPSIWQFFIGAIFIVVILFLPGGLISIKDIPAKLKAKAEKRKADAIETDKVLSENSL